MKPSIRSVLSITETSHSKVSSTVVERAEQDFGMLYVGKNILERLLAYVDASYDIPGVQPPPYRLTDAPQRAMPVISSDQALDAMIGMYREEMAIRQNTPPPLSTAESMYDAAGSQIFPVINYAIKTKENNTIDEEHLPAGGKVMTREKWAAKPGQPLQWRDFFSDLHAGQPVDIREVRKHYFCPYWSRPAPGHLSGEMGTAGRSDYALITSPGNELGGTIASSCDIKPPWVYQTKDIWGIFRGESAFIESSSPNAFQKDRHRMSDTEIAIHRWLFMLYGQAKGLRTIIGCFTNMDVIVFYCYYDGKRHIQEQQDPAALNVPGAVTRARAPRIEPVLRSGLALSWPIPFTHPMALRCLQGMTFMALDLHANRWKEKDALDIVAPGDELVQIVPSMDIPAPGVGLIAPIPQPDPPAPLQEQRTPGDNQREDRLLDEDDGDDGDYGDNDQGDDE